MQINSKDSVRINMTYVMRAYKVFTRNGIL